jgi:hypothetical protein
MRKLWRWFIGEPILTITINGQPACRPDPDFVITGYRLRFTRSGRGTRAMWADVAHRSAGGVR